MDVDELIGQSWAALRRQALVKQRHPAAFELATQWYGHAAWEVRAFALAIFGGLSAKDARALAFLYEHCGEDPAWQANEALAMAFDDYCAGVGYEQAIPVMRQWLGAPHANLRRAVSEGLRPWTASKRAVFARDPRLAIELLGTLKDDASRYVPESAGNALRDISRKHLELVIAALHEWIGESPESKARRTIAKFALKQAVKTDESLRQLFG
jgi:3-methyladenine DNA glycosylase AlkC